jgi:hypothetical protein
VIASREIVPAAFARAAAQGAAAEALGDGI